MRAYSIPMAAILIAGGSVPASADAHLSAKNPCAPISGKATKAKKQGKKAKAKRLRAKYRTCKQATSVRSALAGYTFTGTRGDGEPVTLTLCENGVWRSRIGSSPAAVSSGTTWYVRNLDFTNGSKWVTQVGEYKNRALGGWGMGVARAGSAFQVGIDSFDTVADLGPVSRTPATDCP